MANIEPLDGVYDPFIDERVKNHLNELHEKVNELIKELNNGKEVQDRGVRRA